MQFFLDNIFLIAIAFISGGMLVWPFVRSRAAGPALSTLQATQLINARNAVVVDVRTPEEFAAGSLPGARNVPVDKFDQKLKDIKKDKPLIVVCASVLGQVTWIGPRGSLCTSGTASSAASAASRIATAGR